MPSDPGVTGTPAAVIVARAAALSPMSAIDSGAGPMNVMPSSRQSAEKRSFSARKPYPGWIASAPRVLAAVMSGVHLQVALDRRRRPDADGLVGEGHVPRLGVGLGVHGDGRDAELAAGADDAHGDLAPVGDEDLVEHRAEAYQFAAVLTSANALSAPGG